jgi:hypothetical protein
LTVQKHCMNVEQWSLDGLTNLAKVVRLVVNVEKDLVGAVPGH